MDEGCAVFDMSHKYGTVVDQTRVSIVSVPQLPLLSSSSPPPLFLSAITLNRRLGRPAGYLVSSSFTRQTSVVDLDIEPPA